MSLPKFLIPNSLKIIASILILFLILFLEIYCSPFETLGGENTGWHYPCGTISQELKNLYYSSEIFTFSFLGLILRLLFAYIISSLIVTTFKKLIEK